MGQEVITGDCLDVLRKMEPDSVDAIITDPPYGIDYQSAWRTDSADWRPKIANDSRPFIWWLHDAFRVLRAGGSLLCFHRWDVQETFRVAIEAAGFEIKSQVIWDRLAHGMGDLGASFAPQHDTIWFAIKGAFSFPQDRPKSIIAAMRLGGDQLIHPNEKPIHLMRQLVRAVVEPGGTVLDPFAGSGATGTACRDVGVNFIGIEINPDYARKANERMNGKAPLFAQLDGGSA